MRVPSADRVTKPPKAKPRFVPPFRNGDHMDQKTFHELYMQTPDDFKAELIGGVVYVASPVTWRHGRPHARVVAWLSLYAGESEELMVLDNTTNILDEESEPQPDAALLIDPDSGGQTTINEDDYVVGPPELVAEVAYSSAAIDRHAKRRDYEAFGVREYLIVIVETEAVEWYTRGKRGFMAIKPDENGVYRSRAFPGLWLDPVGIFERGSKRLLTTLNTGLASDEHAKFVAKLAKTRAKRDMS
jgi:Uma2 family endonuclease